MLQQADCHHSLGVADPNGGLQTFAAGASLSVKPTGCGHLATAILA